jgi:hypothetical protein
MKKLALLSAPLFLLMLMAGPSEASSPQVMLEQRLKASYNTMVQDVRNTDDPAAKREIISGFLTRMDKGLAVVQKMSSDETGSRAAQARARIQADLFALQGMNANAPTAAGDFNAFASFVQQDVEQADGVYLSVGAIIIILLILILIL